VSSLGRGLIGEYAAALAEGPSPKGLALPSSRGRWVLAASVLGFGIAALDATVVGSSLFQLPVTLQRAVGFSPLGARSALVPMTIVMLLLSAAAGSLPSGLGASPWPRGPSLSPAARCC
jgi:hypothetical protein